MSYCIIVRPCQWDVKDIPVAVTYLAILAQGVPSTATAAVLYLPSLLLDLSGFSRTVKRPLRSYGTENYRLYPTFFLFVYFMSWYYHTGLWTQFIQISMTFILFLKMVFTQFLILFNYFCFKEKEKWIPPSFFYQKIDLGDISGYRRSPPATGGSRRIPATSMSCSFSL